MYINCLRILFYKIAKNITVYLSLWVHNICIWRLIPLLLPCLLHHNNPCRLLHHLLTTSTQHNTLSLKLLKIWLLLHHHLLPISLLHTRLSHSRLLHNDNLLRSSLKSSDSLSSVWSIMHWVINTEVYPVTWWMELPHDLFD